MSTTRLVRRLNAPRSAVYRALVDAEAVGHWMCPPGMTSQVHTFEPRVGGAFRISLTYADGGSQGKTSGHTDTFHGRFVELVPDEKVVQVVAFETDDPALQGESTMRFELREADGGTELHAAHENVPPGVPKADNDLGWSESLAKLAALVEKR